VPICESAAGAISGQDVLVFDSSRTGVQSAQAGGKVVQKLAGMVWIDEKAHDVARWKPIL